MTAPAAPRRSPAASLSERRILVCVGSGGVGKTTVAAALALAAARAGRRTLVLTIDPARRLADALGVGTLDDVPRELPPQAAAKLGLDPAQAGGRLFAMMLDMKRTFDGLVERFAPDPATRSRILENRIYQHLSDALAGSGEYAAMEKVFELTERDEFELVIVDTPPAQHALDFLDAPSRLLEFLDSRLVQVLLHPAFAAGRFGFRVFHWGAQRALRLLERLSGVSFLEDVSEFLLAFEGMSEGFRERARRVRSLLLGAESGFVLVAGPARQSVRHAQDFLARLEQTGVPLDGIVANRVRTWPGGGEPPALLEDAEAAEAGTALLAEALERAGAAGADAAGAARAAVDAARGYASSARRDADTLRPLRDETRQAGRFWCEVPELPRDVHDLEGLLEIARHVVGEADAAAGVAATAGAGVGAAVAAGERGEDDGKSAGTGSSR